MRIAIVKLSALGDIVHAMIVLQFIKKFNSEILIDWIVEKSYKDLLESHSDINKVHVVNFRQSKEKKSLLALIEQLKMLRKLEAYDLVIDMQGLIKSAVISKLIPSKQTLGFDKFSIRERVASVFYNKTLNYEYHNNIIERNTALIEFALGISISKNEIQEKLSFLHPRFHKLDFNISSTKNNVILIPGASHLSKCYPSAKLAELTTLLDANFIVVWGNDSEKIMANKVKNLSPAVTVCNKLSINSLIILISKVDLVIGPDTGPTHISWAMNIPSITLFGSTPGYRNSYQTHINRIIESKTKVDPYKIDKNDYSVSDIDIQEILNISLELLKD